MKKTLKLLLGGVNKPNIRTIASSNSLHLSEKTMEHNHASSSRKLPKLPKSKKMSTGHGPKSKIIQPPLSNTDDAHIQQMQDNFNKFKKEYNKQFEDTQALYKRIGYDEEQILKTMYLKDLF